MAEESVAEGVLARLEEGEDIGDVLRADIERREGLFFRDWARTTDGWQGIATPAGAAGTLEEPPPRRVRRDEPLNILIYVISDVGHDQNDDEVGSQAYVNLIKKTFTNARFVYQNVYKLYDDKYSDTNSGEFAGGMVLVIDKATTKGIEFDQIHFIGHGDEGVGMLFAGKDFDEGELKDYVPSLPLKPGGVVVLCGCYTEFGPFYDWAVKMAKKADARVCAFRDD